MNGFVGRTRAPLSMALLLLVGLFSGRVDATPICPDSDKSCPVPEYLQISKTGELDHCRLKECRFAAQAPAKPWMFCSSGFARLDCEIWPQGPSFSYNYSTSGGISMSGGGVASSPYVSLNCPTPESTGKLNTWVYAPSGTSSFEKLDVYCPAIAGPSLSGPTSGSVDFLITLSWSSVYGASYYELESSWNGRQWGPLYSGGGLSHTFRVGMGGLHAFRVRACASSGCSSYSATHTMSLQGSVN